MIYREYGSTGIKVSALGFGGMRFEEPLNIDKSVETVLHAFNKGITYFDTAPGYTDDKSETIIGKSVLEMKKTGRPFYISTKSPKADGKSLRYDLEKSLKKLNVDAIDFYHCWCVLTMDDWKNRKKGGAVKEIIRAKEEGLIKHAAFSTHLSGQEISKVIEEAYFEGVTLGYSAINFPHREKGIETAFKNNMGVVVMNPLGGGTIVDNEEAFSFIKAYKGQTILEAALHFLFSSKKITVALVGFRNKQDVDTVVDAVNSFSQYSEEQVESIKKAVKEDFNTLCTTCMYCDVCPYDIPVYKFVETCNYLIFKSGDTDEEKLKVNIRNRLKYYWGVSITELDKCIDCGECELACTQHLPILKRFKELKSRIFNR